MSHEYPDERSTSTGLPVTNHRTVIVGPWEKRRPLWVELAWIALAFFAGLLIGHSL